MTITVLRLLGLETDDALSKAEQLFDLRSGGPRALRRLLVIDDASRLVEHGSAYHRLDSGRRVSDLLCVAVGPVPADELELPENFGGNQGTGVIWVGDELGIDWRFTAPTADGHVGGRVGGLDLLVELLTDDSLFGCVHEAFAGRIPGKVANPGLWLAGADPEDGTFAAALAMAVSRMSHSGPGAAGPFAELLPGAAGGAALTPGGRLARDRDEVTGWVTAAVRSLDKNPVVGKLFGRGGGGARDNVIEAGAVLGGLREHLAQLLRDANAADQPTGRQYELIQKAGIQFPPGTGSGGASGSPVYRVVSDAADSGDTFSFIGDRLQATERGLDRKGSASYLAEVRRRCPQELLDWLANPPQRPPKSADAVAPGEFSVEDARRAASDLAELAVTVADREWSPATPSAAEVARVRISLSIATKTLLSDVQSTGQSTGPAGGAAARSRRAQVTSLAEWLRPVLCDLVLRVVAAACDAPSVNGTQARAAASDLTTRLLRQWKEHVSDHGMAEPPPFAVADGVDLPALEAGRGQTEEIREALLYPPEREMWQLCLPDDLDRLDFSAPPHVIRFAPRLNKDALSGTVPSDTVWTSSGAYAGLLRLVPVEDRFVTAQRTDVGLGQPPGGW